METNKCSLLSCLDCFSTSGNAESLVRSPSTCLSLPILSIPSLTVPYLSGSQGLCIHMSLCHGFQPRTKKKGDFVWVEGHKENPTSLDALLAVMWGSVSEGAASAFSGHLQGKDGSQKSLGGQSECIWSLGIQCQILKPKGLQTHLSSKRIPLPLLPHSINSIANIFVLNAASPFPWTRNICPNF